MFEDKFFKSSKLYAYKFDLDIEKKLLAFVSSFRDALQKDDDSVLQDLKYNPVKFCNFLCKTMSKDPITGLQTITMFELMPRQAEVMNILFHEVFLKQKKCVFLKSRQQGASWMLAALFVHISIFFPNQTLLMTSKDKDSLFIGGDAGSLMGKCQFIINNLPAWFKEVVLKHFYPLQTKLTLQVNKSFIKGQVGSNAGSGGTSSLGLNDEFDLNDNQQQMQSAMQIACGGLIYMSTLKQKGSLFGSMTKNKSYIQIRLSWRDDLRVKDKEGFKKEMIALLGLELWNREYEMKYSEGDEDYLIKGTWIDALREMDISKIDKRIYAYFPIVAGLDCAGQGKDNNVLRIRQGPFEVATYKWNDCYAEESYKKILEAWNIHKFVIVAFDRIGVGFAMEGEFTRHIETIPFYFCGVISSSRLMDERDEVIENVSGEDSKIIYLNLRSRLWWEYRERVRKTVEGTALEYEVIFIQDERVLEELQLFTYTTGSCIQIISKKDLRKKLKKFGGSSPDMADADVYTLYAQEQYLERLEYEHRFGKH